MTRAREISNVLGRNIESTTFTATAGQTALSITHAAGRIQVYMNGLLLDPTVDWTSDGSTVTLTEGAVAGDELEVVKFDNLAVADAIPRTGHTGTIDFSDATFIPASGQVVQEQIYTNSTRVTYSSGTWMTAFPTQTFTKKYSASTTKLILKAQVPMRGGWSFANAPSINVDGTEIYGYGQMTDTATSGTNSGSFNKCITFLAPLTGLASGSRSITLKIKDFNSSGYNTGGQTAVFNPTNSDDGRFPSANYSTMVIKEVMV